MVGQTADSITPMRKLLNALVSKRTSMALMVFIVIAGALGAWIPQEQASTPETMSAWAERNPLFSRLADALGLHAIFSSMWFVAIVGIFAFALGVASWSMVKKAWLARKASHPDPRTIIPDAEIGPIVERALAAGFKERPAKEGCRSFVRHAAGTWAPAVLHVGLLVSLVSGAIMLGLTRRAVVDFSQGEIYEPGECYSIEDRGSTPEFSRAVRFDGIEAETWPKGGLKDVTARLAILQDDGTWLPQAVRVNHPLRLEGHTIYVMPDEFGKAAFLVFSGPGGVEDRVRMEFPFAQDGQVVYTEVPLTVEGVEIEGRWDPSCVRDTKPLALRLAHGGEEPVVLSEGDRSELGPLEVEFVGAGDWARFIVQRSPSIVPLFVGFVIVCLGSLMLYMWIPRELVLEEVEDGVRYSWHAARMPQSFLAERDAILGIGSSSEGVDA